MSCQESIISMTPLFTPKSVGGGFLRLKIMPKKLPVGEINPWNLLIPWSRDSKHYWYIYRSMSYYYVQQKVQIQRRMYHLWWMRFTISLTHFCYVISGQSVHILTLNIILKKSLKMLLKRLVSMLTFSIMYSMKLLPTFIPIHALPLITLFISIIMFNLCNWQTMKNWCQSVILKLQQQLHSGRRIAAAVCLTWLISNIGFDFSKMDLHNVRLPLARMLCLQPVADKKPAEFDYLCTLIPTADYRYKQVYRYMLCFL